MGTLKNRTPSAANGSGRGTPDIALDTDIQTAAAGRLQIKFLIQFSQQLFRSTEVVKACRFHRAVDRFPEGHPDRGTGNHAALGEISRSLFQRFKWLKSDDEIAEGFGNETGNASSDEAEQQVIKKLEEESDDIKENEI